MPVDSNNHFLKNVFKLGGASVISQSLGIIAAPIFARLFSPEQVGTFSLWLSLAALLGIFSTCRYELALILPKKEKEAINVFAGAVGISIVWSIFLGISFFAGAQHLILGTKYEMLSQFLWLIPISVFIGGVSQSLDSWFNRKKYFGVNAGLRVTNSVLTRVGNLGGGFLGFSTAIYLVYVSLTVSLITFLIKIGAFFRVSSKSLKNISFRGVLQAMVRYRKFPLIDIWGAFLNTFSVQVAPLMLAYFFTTTEVGYYSQGMRLIQLPMILVGGAVSQVYFQRASEVYHQGNLAPLLEQVQRSLFVVGVFPFMILGLYGEELFSVFLGVRWQEAGIYAQLMAPWCFFVFCGSPISTTIVVLEKQGSYLVFNILTAALRFIALFIGAQLESCRIALLLYSLTGVLLWFGFISFLFHESGLAVMNTWKENLQSSIPTLIAAVPLILVKIFVSSIILQGIYVSLIAVGFMGYTLLYSRAGSGIMSQLRLKFSKSVKEEG